MSDVSEQWIKIPADLAAEGLFIAQLDRPWQGTPFKIEGFMVDDETLPLLPEFAGQVYIDPRRSAWGPLSELPAEYIAHLRLDYVPTPERNERMREEDSKLLIYPPQMQGATILQAVREAVAVKSTPEDDDRLVSVSKPRAAPDSAPVGDGFLITKVIESVPVIGPELPAPTGWRPLGYNAWLKLGETVRSVRAGLARPRTRKADETPDFIPPNHSLIVYPSSRPITRDALLSVRKGINKVTKVVDLLYNEVLQESSFELEELEDAIAQLVRMILTDPDAAMWMARMKEYDTPSFSRSIKTSIYIMTLGRHIGYPMGGLIKLGTIAMLLDVGKLNLDKAMLDTAGPLSETEMKMARTHVTGGIQLLEAQKRLDPDIKLGILHHHERGDGSGYPLGLKDREISVFGQMAGLVDTLAAMTSPRPYAPTYSNYDAIMHLFAMADRKKFHPPLVEQLVQAIGLFPVGTLVELSSGEVGAVAAHNPIRRLEPKVLVLTQPDKTALATPFERDLLYRPTDAEGRAIYIIRGLPIGAYDIDPRKFYLG
jgi:HD-GYP domain-containing protein (c-di-GMP phosphodiesterase class II)